VAESNGKRRFFSAEYKLEAVRRMDERRGAGVPLTQIARELGVGPDLLRAWKRQAGERTGAPRADVFPGQGRLPSDEEEMRRLRRELDRVTQERDFLRKAAAFFARESPTR
jgi:transposase